MPSFHFLPGAVLAPVLIALACAPGAQAGDSTIVLRVEGDNGSANPPGLGNGWGADAYRYLADALARAQQLSADPAATVQIWVAARAPNHPYLPDHSAANPGGTGSPGAKFLLRSRVQLYGGFLGTRHPVAPENALSQRDPEHNVTVLSGNVGDPGSSTDNSQFIVYAYNVNSTAVLSGFTITGATGDAVILLQSSPKITRCIVRSNHSVSGAGVQVLGFSAPGANPIFVNCSFIDNHALSTGGGMNIGVFSGVTLVNCVFSENSAAATGGGLYAVPTYGLNVINCTFSGNTAQSSGGGLSVAPQAAPVHVTNCILWGNSVSAVSTSLEGAQVSVMSHPELFSATYSCIQGLVALDDPAAGNIGVDPHFTMGAGVDGVAGSSDNNLRPSACSPAVNAGLSSAVPADAADIDDDLDVLSPTPDRDLRGRIVDCSVDMGAYEHQAHCTGDVNGDGRIDLVDLGVLVSSWAAFDQPGPSESDLDCNDTVNAIDLGILLAHWGVCPACGD